MQTLKSKKLMTQTMAYSVHGHISYILEANSKRPIREKIIVIL